MWYKTDIANALVNEIELLTDWLGALDCLTALLNDPLVD